MLCSILFHAAVLGIAALAGYNVQTGSSASQDKVAEPVFVTFVQETLPQTQTAEQNVEKVEEPKPPEEAVETTMESEDQPKEYGQAAALKPTEKKEKHPAPQTQNAQIAQTSTQVSKTPKQYSGGTGQAEIQYKDQVRAAIHANRIYPRQARMRGMEGEALVELKIARDGSLQSYRFVKTSGHHILDQAARKMIEKSNPLPPLPPDILLAPLAINVPIGFQLQSR